MKNVIASSVVAALAILVLFLGCGKQQPAEPAMDTATVTRTSTITPTNTISETHTVSPTVTETGTITMTATITPTSARPFMATDVTNITSATNNTNFVSGGYGTFNTGNRFGQMNSSNVFTHLSGPLGTAQALEVMLYGGTVYDAQVLTMTTPQGVIDVYIPAIAACPGMAPGNTVILYIGDDGSTYYRYSGLNCVNGTKIDYTFEQASSMPAQLGRMSP